MRIEKLLPIDVLTVNLLADKVFGKGYLTKSYFLNAIESRNFQGYVLRENTKVIAFCIVYKAKREDLIVKLKDDSLDNYFSEQLICLDTIVVSDAYRRKGLASLLIKKVIEDNIDATIYLNAWKQNGFVNLASVINKFGFRLYKEYLDIWKLECELNQFVCPSKKEGENCCCSSVLYYRSPK